MMIYIIWIIATSIFKIVLNLKTQIKFCNSSHILQTINKLEFWCHVAMLDLEI